jgi:ABC-2 type transport system permease protein
MMLAYKAWRESAARFGVSVLALLWIGLVFVVLQPGRVGASAADTYVPFIRHAMYEGFVREMFIVFAMVLGFGGLLQERARGTVGFTLALPVSRTRLLTVRALIGLLEVVGLALIPALVLVCVSPLVHEGYPLSEAVRFSALWSGAGMAIFAIAFVLSTAVGGEIAAPAACVATIFLYLVVAEVPPLGALPAFNVLQLMNAGGPLPLTRLLLTIGVACGLVAVADGVTRRQDF